MSKPTTHGPESLAATLRAVAIVGATATAAAALLGGGRAMLGVGIGAAVAIGNLWLVGRVVRGFVAGTAQAPWGFVAAVKFTLLVVLLWVLLKSGVVDLLPLVIGYGALPLGIFASQLGGASPARERG
jgi:hypothetical protein